MSAKLVDEGRSLLRDENQRKVRFSYSRVVEFSAAGRAEVLKLRMRYPKRAREVAGNWVMKAIANLDSIVPSRCCAR